MTKALGLLSGGLDSILASRLIMNLGVHVTGLTFTSPFFGAERAKDAARMLGIELIVRDITEEHLEIVRKPHYGYGKNFNPCVDCHALMLRSAGALMEELGYDFIFTGEVVGQRPFSQNIRMLQIVAEASGYPDRLLRPLTAKKLKMTEVERIGLVDREQLLDIYGRGRKRQFELAKKWGITRYSNPAGGCLLTDVNFCARMKAAIDDGCPIEVRMVELLKLGRHFRLRDGVRLIVGKNHADNEAIVENAPNDGLLVKISDLPGPTGLFSGEPNEEDIAISSAILARYTDISADGKPELLAWSKDGSREFRRPLEKAFTPEETLRYLITKDNGS
ncbi:MAG: DUF814 domain-containing protein [Planctomycetota bacterium]